MMTVLEHNGPNAETIDLLTDLFSAIDPDIAVTTDPGKAETWISLKAVNSRSLSKFIGKKGKVFNALRTIATVLSGVDKHRYMIRLTEACDE
jgi:predicted RNA-binding protein YlqC (UPF0109 family)